MILDKGTFGLFPAGDITRLGLNPREQTVLAWLVFHTNQSGTCFPAMATLARESGMCVASVKNVIKSLQDKGLVIVAHRYRDDGGQTSNFSTIQLEGAGGVAKIDTPPQLNDDSPPSYSLATNQKKIEPNTIKFDARPFMEAYEEAYKTKCVPIRSVKSWKQACAELGEEDSIKAFKAYLKATEQKYYSAPRFVELCHMYAETSEREEKKWF